MDGAIDLRLVVSIVGILISLGGAMAVTKQSLKVQADLISDLEARLRQLDSRTDRLITQIETQAQIALTFGSVAIIFLMSFAATSAWVL